MAWAVPSVVLALARERNAAEVRAHAENNEPRGVVPESGRERHGIRVSCVRVRLEVAGDNRQRHSLATIGVGLLVAESGNVHGFGRRDLFSIAVANEDRFSTPASVIEESEGGSGWVGG